MNIIPNIMRRTLRIMLNPHTRQSRCSILPTYVKVFVCRRSSYWDVGPVDGSYHIRKSGDGVETHLRPGNVNVTGWKLDVLQ